MHGLSGQHVGILHQALLQLLLYNHFLLLLLLLEVKAGLLMGWHRVVAEGKNWLLTGQRLARRDRLVRKLGGQRVQVLLLLARASAAALLLTKNYR